MFKMKDIFTKITLLFLLSSIKSSLAFTVTCPITFRTTTKSVNQHQHHQYQHQHRHSSLIRTAITLNEAPVLSDRSDTIEKVKIDEDKTTAEDPKPSTEEWKIRLFDDPYNKREFVSRCLTTICGKSDTESYQVMMEAHKKGMGIIGRYRFEVAELYHNSLKDEGLSVDMILAKE